MANISIIDHDNGLNLANFLEKRVNFEVCKSEKLSAFIL